MAHMDAHLVLYIFLPPLIFESAYNVNGVHFGKVVFASIVYAVPGLILCSGMTAGCLMLLYPEWTILQAGLLGSLLSATDPVAVVALLKQIGTGSLLDTLIEAESLLNDGTAMVVFSVLFEAVKAGHVEASAFDIFVQFFQMAIGGACFGLFSGYIFSQWIGTIFNHSEVEVSLTVCAAYLTFFVGEHFLGVSGVLAVVACGIYMGNRGDTLVSPEVEEFLHEFWELLAFLANTCIFVITGLIIFFSDMQFNRWDTINCVVLYTCIMLIRVFMFSLFNPLIAMSNHFIPNKRETAICCWGALRGAVALALGMLVYDNKVLKNSDDPVRARYGDLVLFHASGIVILTLLLNAMTVQKLLQFLGLDRIDELKEKLFRVSMEEIQAAGTREVESLKLDEMISCASWPNVRKHGFELDETDKKRVKDEPMYKSLERTDGKESSVSNERSYRRHLSEVRELRESRRRFLAAVKASYRNQFRHGLLSREALRFLENLTEKMIDNDCVMTEWLEIGESHLFSRVRRRSNAILNFLMKRWDFANLQFGYDVVCGFFHARVEALHSMSLILGTDSAAYDHIASQVQEDQTIARKTILEVQRHLPEIAANIATLRAARSMLNAQRNAASELYEGGFLDKLEHTRVVTAIETKMNALQRVSEISLPSKYDLVKEISWLSGASDATVQLFSDAAEEIFVDEGDCIIRQGESGDNLFLIARGIAKVNVFNEETSVEETLTDIGVGQLIGEMAFLTRRKREASVVAASRGVVFAFRGNQIRSILTGEKRIEDKLWESAGWRMGENMLRGVDPYNSWDRSELRRWLIQWMFYSPNANVKSIDIVRPSILIDGTVQQPWQVLTGEFYGAPKYLQPQGGKPMKLKLGKGVKILCPPGAVRYSQEMKLNPGDNDKIFRKRGWALVKEKFVQDKKKGWNSLAANFGKLIDGDKKMELLGSSNEKIKLPEDAVPVPVIDTVTDTGTDTVSGTVSDIGKEIETVKTITEPNRELKKSEVLAIAASVAKKNLPKPQILDDDTLTHSNHFHERRTSTSVLSEDIVQLMMRAQDPDHNKDMEASASQAGVNQSIFAPVIEEEHGEEGHSPLSPPRRSGATVAPILGGNCNDNGKGDEPRDGEATTELHSTQLIKKNGSYSGGAAKVARGATLKKVLSVKNSAGFVTNPKAKSIDSQFNSNSKRIKNRHSIS